MRNNKSQVSNRNVRLEANKHRPEIRDDLDHREGEEQETKGSDITHNKKEHHNQPKKKKK